MRAQLVPMEAGKPIEIVKDMSIIGRGEECDIRLDHKSISKIHCVIVRTDGLLLLRDLGSTNGTRVNGTRIRRAVLLPNDKVSIANRHFRTLFGAALADAEPEKTVQIASVDAALLGTRAAAPHALADSMEDEPIVQVQANILPDVYPEGDGKKG